MGITIFRRIIEIEKCRERLGFEPVPTPSEKCCPIHCSMGTIAMEFLTNVIEIIKMFGTNETRTEQVATPGVLSVRIQLHYFCSDLKLIQFQSINKSTENQLFQRTLNVDFRSKLNNNLI